MDTSTVYSKQLSEDSRIKDTNQLLGLQSLRSFAVTISSSFLFPDISIGPFIFQLCLRSMCPVNIILASQQFHSALVSTIILCGHKNHQLYCVTMYCNLCKVKQQTNTGTAWHHAQTARCFSELLALTKAVLKLIYTVKCNALYSTRCIVYGNHKFTSTENGVNLVAILCIFI